MNESEQLRDLAKSIRAGCVLAPKMAREVFEDGEGGMCVMGAAVRGAGLLPEMKPLMGAPVFEACYARWPILAKGDGLFGMGGGGWRAGNYHLVVNLNNCGGKTREEIADMLDAEAAKREVVAVEG